MPSEKDAGRHRSIYPPGAGSAGQQPDEKAADKDED